MKGTSTPKTDEQRYRVLIDNAPEPVFILDAESGKFIDFNKNATDLFKFSQEELKTMGPLDVSPKTIYGHEAVSHASIHIEEALQGGNPAFDWIHLTSEGTEIPCEIRLVRLPPYNRKLIRASVIDRRDQKKLEAALRESEERLKLALGATGLGCFDWNLQKNEVHWDERAHMLFGLPPDSEKDRNEHFFSIVHPDDQERVQGNFIYLINPSTNITDFEDRYRIIVGDRIRHIQSHGIAFRNKNGAVIRIIGTIQDITNEKEAEQELKETRWILEEAQRIAHIGSWDWDMRTHETYWSDELYRIYGREPDQGPPSVDTFIDHVHPEDQEGLQIAIERAMAGVNPYSVEYRIFRYNDGVERYLHAEGEVLFDEEGKPERLIGSVQDVTRRKLMEKAVRRSEGRYRSVVESSLDAFFLLESVTDTQGEVVDFRIVEINENAAHQMSMPREELLGVLICEKFPVNRTNGFFDQYKQVFETGEPLSQDYFIPGNHPASGWYHHQIVRVGEGIAIMNRDIWGRKQTEQALRNAKEYAENLIETANVMVVGLDLEGRITIFNQAAEKISGYSRAELEHKKWFETLVPKDHYPDIWERFKHVKEGRLNKVSENPIVTKSGAERLINWQNSEVYEDGKVIGTISFGIDITERNQAEEALRNSEARFRSVFDQQFQFMAILSPEGRILEINDLPLKTQQATRKDFVGKYFWDMPGWKRLPEWRQIIQEQIAQAITLDEPLLTEDIYEAGDGTIRYAMAAYSTIRDPEGNIRFILVQGTDITERKQAEEQLKQAQEELSELTNRFQISTKAARVGIWDWDVKADALIWDETMYELYGIIKDKFSGAYNSWIANVHPEDVLPFKQEVEDALKGEKEFNTEFRVVLPDQSDRFIKAFATVQRDPKGHPIRMIGTNWDITKEKEAERQKIRARQLELKNKELEQFAYVALS